MKKEKLWKKIKTGTKIYRLHVCMRNVSPEPSEGSGSAQSRHFEEINKCWLSFFLICCSYWPDMPPDKISSKKNPKTLLWLKCRSFCSYFESSNISQMAMLLQFMEGSCHHSLQTFLPQEFQADTLSSHKNIIKYYSTLNKRKLVKESFDAWCVYVNLLNGEIIQHS